MPHLKLAFLGFGNVGRALLQLWLDKGPELRERYGIEWSVVGIGTRRHGSALDPDGIDPEQALALAAAGESLHPLSARTAPERADEGGPRVPAPEKADEGGPRVPAPESGVEFVHACEADILFENTPVNYQDGQPAVAHLEAALDRGMHAVTANKGPVVHAYRELTAKAAARGRRFLFEATVMGGAPVFSLWRASLPGARLLSFRGVLNATTNLILTQMESGSTFDDAVAHAQAIGIAETDPSGDILGWDAAVKVAALVTVLMDHPLRPSDVERRGIEGITPEQIAQAGSQARRWKLVCHAEIGQEGIRASVVPEAVGQEDTLYSVTGSSSAITFWSDVLGPLTVAEVDPGPMSTAYGLLADTLNAVRHM